MNQVSTAVAVASSVALRQAASVATPVVRVVSPPPTVSQALSNIAGGARGVTISDTAANVLASLSQLHDARASIASIKLTDAGAVVFNITADQARYFSASVTDKDVFNKIGTRYSLSIADSAANISANIGAVQGANAKVTSLVANDATRQAVTVSVGQYAASAAALAKLQGAALTVSFAGNMSDYRVTPNANNTFTVTDLRRLPPGQAGDGTHTLKGANFLAFSDVTTFADSGNAAINALLNGGTSQWWSAAGTRSATSATQLAPGLYGLDASSSRHAFTYSFLSSIPAGDTQDAPGFRAMSDTQKASVRQAFDYLSSLINVTFTEGTAGTSDINLGTNDQTSFSSAGYASLPNASGSHPVYLFLDNGARNTNSDLAPGTYGWETLIHEIGHTLGLKHPGNYNAGGGGAPGPYLPGATDNRRYSVMSYKDPVGTGNVTASPVQNGTSYSAASLNPMTYMQYDIAALQFLYGANTAGTPAVQSASFDGSWKGLETLWTPAGGTLDTSAVTNASLIDLRDGAFSSINVLPDTTVSALPSVMRRYQTYLGLNNVSLAYGSAIGSVKGGAGTEVVYANATDSVSIDGGGGSDTVYLAGAAADWTGPVGGGLNGTYANSRLGINVTVSNIERVRFYNAATAQAMHSKVDLLA